MKPTQTPLTNLWWTLLLALLCVAPTGAQTLSESPPSDCTAPEAITPAHLYGLWQLTLGTAESPGGEGQIVFTRHPEFPGSVRGTLERQVQDRRYSALVAGDVTNQGFQLEESADGTHIDAVWSGEVSPTGCGRKIKGWRSVIEGNSAQAAPSEQPFLLEKSPGWR